MIETPSAVIFDFDLTLADSTDGFLESHTRAAERLGLTPPDRDTVRRSIGTPLEIVVPRMYGDAIAGRVGEYIDIYQERADEVMTARTVMLPAASNTLRQLNGAGLKLAIVSQKLRYRVEDVLRREHLLDCFTVVLGGEDVPAYKPDPAGLLLALQRLGVTAQDALYVGDTTIDAEAASNAGLRFVGVLTGVTNRDDFRPFQSLALLESVTELPEFFGVS